MRYSTRRVLIMGGVVVALASGAVAIVLQSNSQPAVRSAPSPTSAPTSTRVSPAAKDFAQKVSWVTACTVSRVANDDPIVFPNQPGLSHQHTFSGSKGINASSTTAQLITQPTTCENSEDRSAYWMPTLFSDGRPVEPYVTRAYYRAATRDTAAVRPSPPGLRMIAGDAMATSPQNKEIAGFHCRIEKSGATVSKQSLPPHCPSGSILEASVVFPNCWDGVHLDSADHRSHMSYAVSMKCDAGHPVMIPQLTVAERFPVGSTNGKIILASMGSPLTLHADFMDGWAPAEMNRLVTLCIHGGLACAGISDRRPAPKSS